MGTQASVTWQCHTLRGPWRARVGEHCSAVVLTACWLLNQNHQLILIRCNREILAAFLTWRQPREDWCLNHTLYLSSIDKMKASSNTKARPRLDLRGEGRRSPPRLAPYFNCPHYSPSFNCSALLPFVVVDCVSEDFGPAKSFK